MNSLKGGFIQIINHDIKMNNKPVVLERTLNALIEKVWTAITDKDAMKDWYFDLAVFQPEVGFEFSFKGGTEHKTYVHRCRVTEVEVGRKITYSWRYEGYEGISYVTFELFDDSGKTKVRLTHDGLDTFPANNPDFARENFVQGWTHFICQALPGYVESPTTSL